MSDDPRSRTETIVDSIAGKIIARFVIPPIATAGLWVGGWYLNKQSNTLDRVEKHAITAMQSTELLTQQIELRARARDSQMSDIQGRIADHEGRIRTLERPLR